MARDVVWDVLHNVFSYITTKHTLSNSALFDSSKSAEHNNTLSNGHIAYVRLLDCVEIQLEEACLLSKSAFFLR